MGVLVDYFTAPSDEDAAVVLDSGPGERFPSTEGTGIEPVVMLGRLEELLTGKTFSQQLVDPASRPLVASGRDHHRLVIKIDNGFARALADADRSTLDDLAVPWSQAEEIGGTADPELLADFLRRLQDLAGAATSTGSAVYCWLCL